MERTTAVAVAGFGLLVCVVSCKTEKAPVAITAPATSAASAPKPAEDEPPMPSVPEALEALRAPQPAVRERAARALRKAIAADPAAAGDPGEAFWKDKLAAVRPGVTTAQFEKATGARAEGGASSGRSTSSIFRLDDYWTVQVSFDLPDSLRAVGPLARRPRAVWVAPAKDFSGKWVTYFVNGAVAHDIQYKGGSYERFSAYYDNGQLTYEQRYVDGKIDGAEVGYHPSGKKAYEINHSAGKNVGRWVHWYPNGKLESEQTYVAGALDGKVIHWREDGTKSSRIDYRAGKEIGQAAWDEKGKLLYAHGSVHGDEK